MIHRKINKSLKDLRINIGKFMFDKKCKKNSIDLTKTNRVLFLRKDNKIGDMLVNTIAFRELKKAYSNIKIEVVCGKDSAEIISGSPYVDEVYIFQKGILNEQKLIKKLKNNKYDILIDLSEQTTFEKLMYVGKIGANVNIGFKKSGYNLYDISIEKEFSGQHESQRYFELLKNFGITEQNSNYDIFIDSKYEIEADLRMQPYSKSINVIVNRYGANKHRTFKEDVMKQIVDAILKISPSINIILLYPPFKEKESIEFAQKYKDGKVVCFQGMRSIMESTALMKRSSVSITPETAIVHIACALGGNLVSVYRNSPDKVKEWGPISEKSTVVMSNNRRDINDVDCSKVTDAVKNYLMETNGVENR